MEIIKLTNNVNKSIPKLDFESAIKVCKGMKSKESDSILSSIQKRISSENKIFNDYKDKLEKDRRVWFFLKESRSLYNAPLIDFIGEQYDRFVNTYSESKCLKDKEIHDCMINIWKVLSKEHERFYNIASKKEFYASYRSHCINYIYQRYKIAVDHMAYVFKASGVKQYRIAANIAVMNAVVNLSEVSLEQIGDQIRSAIDSNYNNEEYSLVNINRMLDFISKKLDFKFDSKFLPKVDKFYEDFYSSIYVKKIINYGLDHTKKEFREDTYNARLHAINIFGDKIFTNN